MTLRVVAYIRAKAGKEEELKAILASLTHPTRQEKGCIEYKLYQNKQDPQDFTFVEEWESDATLDAHLQTPHVQGAVAKLLQIVQSPPDIRRYNLVA